MPQSIHTMPIYYNACLNQYIPYQSTTVHASINTYDDNLLQCMPQSIHTIPTNYSMPQSTHSISIQYIARLKEYNACLNQYVPYETITFHASINACQINPIYCTPQGIRIIINNCGAFHNQCMPYQPTTAHSPIYTCHVNLLQCIPQFIYAIPTCYIACLRQCMPYQSNTLHFKQYVS